MEVGSLDRDSFASLDEVKDYCMDLSRTLGFAIVIARSRTKSQNRKTVYFGCVYGGKYKSQGKGLRQSSSCKRNCPFKLVARERKEDLWILEVQNGHHNHEMTKDPSQLVPHRKLTDEQQTYAADLIKNGVRPRDVVKIFKEKNLPQINSKDVHNIIRRRLAQDKREEAAAMAAAASLSQPPPAPTASIHIEGDNMNAASLTAANLTAANPAQPPAPLDSDQLSLLQRAVKDDANIQLNESELAQIRLILQLQQEKLPLDISRRIDEVNKVDAPIDR